MSPRVSHFATPLSSSSMRSLFRVVTGAFQSYIRLFVSLRAKFCKVFFAVITPNSAHFAGNHSATLDMQDLEPLFTLYSTLQLCASLCRHFAGTLRTFYKKTPLKPFNCTILHNPAKCETPLYNTQPLIYKGFNIYM